MASGGGVAEAVAHGVAGRVGRKLHALGVDGVFLAAELLAHFTGAVGEDIAVSLAAGDFTEHLFYVIRFAEFQPEIAHALFFELHGEGHGTGGGDGIHAQFIQHVVPADDLFDIVVQDIGAEQAQDFEFGPLYHLIVHLYHARAADGAGGAGGVGYQMLFGQLLARDLFKPVEPTGAEVFGGQNFMRLHGGDEARRAQLGELTAGERVGF